MGYPTIDVSRCSLNFLITLIVSSELQPQLQLQYARLHEYKVCWGRCHQLQIMHRLPKLMRCAMYKPFSSVAAPRLYERMLPAREHETQECSLMNL
jgi:hypothetical protein